MPFEHNSPWVSFTIVHTHKHIVLYKTREQTEVIILGRLKFRIYLQILALETYNVKSKMFMNIKVWGGFS